MLAMAPFLAMPAARVFDYFVLSTRGDRASPRITGRIVAEAIDTHVAIDVDAPVNNEKFPLLHFEYRNGSSAIDIKKAPQSIERRIFSCGSAAVCLTHPRFLRKKSDKVLSRTGTSERIVYTRRSRARYRNQHFFNESGADFSRRSLWIRKAIFTASSTRLPA